MYRPPQPRTGLRTCSVAAPLRCCTRARRCIAPQVKVCDFNLSRMVAQQQQLTNSGNPNSPGWQSPEMLAGQPYGKASDVFSFGVGEEPRMRMQRTRGAPERAAERAACCMLVQLRRWLHCAAEHSPAPVPSWSAALLLIAALLARGPVLWEVLTLKEPWRCAAIINWQAMLRRACWFGCVRPLLCARMMLSCCLLCPQTTTRLNSNNIQIQPSRCCHSASGRRRRAAPRSTSS